MRVLPIPCYSDNYAYLVIDRHGNAAAVDPADPEKVLHHCQRQRARLEAVLTTHGHKDHSGGNKQLAAHLPELQIVGGARESVPARTRAVRHEEELEIGSLRVTCLETPYHSHGHMCFLVREEGCEGPSVVFTGDALFVGGCGRRFSGTPVQMYDSLVRVLGRLPPDTLVYCGHEYTVANLEFAASVDGRNPAVQAKLAWAKEQREKDQPTVPSTIAEELSYNPFLRCHEPAIQRCCGTYPGDASGSGAAEDPTEGPRQDGSAGDSSTAGQAAAEGSSGRGRDQVQRPADEVAAIRTLGELRSRKDTHTLSARLVTAAVTVAGWLGMGP